MDRSRLCAKKAMRPLLIALLLALAFPVLATKRSPGAIADFKKEQPCPANGATKGPCKGYVIDHIKALACGGADRPSNMQWQTVEEAKAKDKWERKECRK